MSSHTTPCGEVIVEVFRSQDGRVFANVNQNGIQLAHLKAGESYKLQAPHSADDRSTPAHAGMAAAESELRQLFEERAGVPSASDPGVIRKILCEAGNKVAGVREDLAKLTPSATAPYGVATSEEMRQRGYAEVPHDQIPRKLRPEAPVSATLPPERIRHIAGSYFGEHDDIAKCTVAIGEALAEIGTADSSSRPE